VISIGSRLDLKATGSPVSSFAPNAKKIMVDIDPSELRKFEKFGMKIDLPICLDISSPEFAILIDNLAAFDFQVDSWTSEILALKSVALQEPRDFSNHGANPYFFITELSKVVPAETNTVIDTGCAVAWTMQEWLVKDGQRLIHDFNNTAMGWSIPAAIASALSPSERMTICIVGDGSLMMAQNDLSTLSMSGGPVVVFLLNNGGYSMIKQTQDQWFDGDYFASSSKVDLHFSDFELLAKANNFSYFKIENSDQIVPQLKTILKTETKIFCEVIIQSDARVVPIVKFGKPNHQMDPEL
jgi:acetolactate synthase-1/2/3 large subunit